jgi:ribosomal protein S18 acetylase RimI-like enzyme
MTTNITITDLLDDEIDLLQYLVDEFVLSHRSLPFSDNHWSVFKDWLLTIRKEENSKLLAVRSDERIIGFAVCHILDNSPLLFPEKIGYVRVMIIAGDFRRCGTGKALWNSMKDWFLSKGIEQVELYTEHNNAVAEIFWENHGFVTFLHRRKCHIGQGS